ncbi:MarR family winged helix-turn-helix transcriptional regulator [Rhizobium helianthi]|uniref:MarR family winged helix-turn-helix transcriptional regulator n=1 Tax=Rhizobium helianthi TaxID=1132695 RepID=A0ABW4M4J8_9HYPH
MAADKTLGLGFLLTDAARWLRAAFERRISEAGLGITAGEARTLLNVYALKDCRQLDIAQRMGVEPMTVCAFLDKLQALDLIDRQPDPADRRAKRVTLTPAAIPLITKIEEELDRMLSFATRDLTEEQVAGLQSGLRSMIGNLQEDVAPLAESRASEAKIA